MNLHFQIEKEKLLFKTTYIIENIHQTSFWDKALSFTFKLSSSTSLSQSFSHCAYQRLFVHLYNQQRIPN